MVRVGRVRGLFDPAMEALPVLGVLAVLMIGSLRVESGATSPADLIQVAYLFTLLAFPIRAFGWVLGEMPRSVVGWNRVRNVLDATGGFAYGERAPARARRAEPARRRGRPVLLRRRRGACTASTSPSARARPSRWSGRPGPASPRWRACWSGWSTPTAGTVELDRVDVRELEAGGVADAAALVFQQTFLFDDTVRGNVTLGVPGVSDEDVWAALAAGPGRRLRGRARARPRHPGR